MEPDAILSITYGGDTAESTIDIFSIDRSDSGHIMLQFMGVDRNTASLQLPLSLAQAVMNNIKVILDEREKGTKFTITIEDMDDDKIDSKFYIDTPRGEDINTYSPAKEVGAMVVDYIRSLANN